MYTLLNGKKDVLAQFIDSPSRCSIPNVALLLLTDSLQCTPPSPHPPQKFNQIPKCTKCNLHVGLAEAAVLVLYDMLVCSPVQLGNISAPTFGPHVIISRIDGAGDYMDHKVC